MVKILKSFPEHEQAKLLFSNVFNVLAETKEYYKIK